MENNMIQKSMERLEVLLDIIPPKLGEIDSSTFSYKPAPGKWSKKEILGHLVDSAANNHQRFMRAQYEDAPAIWYDQDAWVACSNYQNMDKDQLIEFWKAYNKHLLFIIKNIPADKLNRTCTMKDGSTPPLEYLIIDYVDHMEHHLGQIIKY